MTTMTRRNTALTRQDLVVLVAEHAELLAAARATVAAARLNQPGALIHLVRVLARHGQLPLQDAQPTALLARSTAATLATCTCAPGCTCAEQAKGVA